jgi:hypothetical protein
MFIKPNWPGTGLSNQLFFIVTSILIAIKENIKLIVLDDFRLEPMVDKMCPVREVIDLSHLNSLTKRYNIKIIDTKDITFEMNKITYGIENNEVDITQYMIQNHITNNILRIPARLNLNGIAGDPAPGVSKKLFINYSINGVQYQDQFSEYLFDQVVYDLINADQFNGWYQVDINSHNSRLFNYFLKNIKFTDLFIKFSNSALLIDKHNKYTLMTDLDKTKKIDVIHLRLEPDMTYNMSVHNNMNEIDYIKKLENNYIELIKKYFSKDNIIIILCYTKDNEVTKFLKENGYDYYLTQKFIFNGREPHAIVDLLVGEKCNDVFIGNWNHKKQIGSTFSYVLDVKMDSDVKRVFTNIYDIKQSEVVVN